MSGIAIVGFQGRFPGSAKSASVFFDQLLAADCFCGDVPADRWSKTKYVTKAMAAGKTRTGRGSFLDYDYRVSTRTYSVFPPTKLPFWTRSSGSFSKWPGKRWNRQG
jgi:hypothetical protein